MDAQTMRTFLAGIALVAMSAMAAEEAVVQSLKKAEHAKSGLTVVNGEVTLPGKGIWTVVNPLPENAALSDVMLEAPQEVYQASLGQRGQALQHSRMERDYRSQLRGVYWTLARWAQAHEGHVPGRADLDKSGKSVLDRAFNAMPRSAASLLNPPPAPHAALVPGTIFEFSTPRRAGYNYARGTNGAPVLVELHPLEDDGKHYVLHADASFTRVAIDEALMRSLGVTITPLTLDPSAGEYRSSAWYRLLAQQRRAAECRVSLTNATTGATLAMLCPAEAVEGDQQLLKDWAEWRERIWHYLVDAYDAPGVRTWAMLQREMLMGKTAPAAPAGRNRRNRGATTDMMGVLGGRAALRETLQLEALRVSASTASNTVPLESVSGVEVTSHPFEEMLGRVEPVAGIPLADYVPHDRFFIGVSKPQALMPILDDGAAFLSRVGAGATGRALRYDLKTRYMTALGVSDTLVRTLVENGAIAEMALFTPDLFFADGTDLTVIARMRGSIGIKLLLKLAGVSLTGMSDPVALKTTDGGTAWWGMADDLMVMGTRASDVASVMALAKKSGEGSLGQSAEFRYMLTRVPPTQSTRAYVYFSDPFIRRLVGPEVKIGQVRRLYEKASLQSLAYASMLRARDGQGTADSLEALATAGYLPKNTDTHGLRIDASGVPVSDLYGPLPRMESIYVADLSHVSTNEAAAYASYKENYTRYWRRFFDPIAICVDEDGDELVATTYILPLLDNSLYDGVRNVVNADPDVPLRIPSLSPHPTGMLSLNLSEKAWREIFRDGFFRLAEQMGITGNALDQLGPAFHFAVFDAEPIIAFGSRSMLGMGGRFGDFDDEMAIPLMISLFTRPCAMLVELQDPKPVRAVLAEGGLTRVLARWEDSIRVTSYQVSGRDSWVIGFDVFGLSLRFSLSLIDDYLVIGNMPWREGLSIAPGMQASVSGASVRVSPEAAKVERAALHLSAMEGQRQSVMEGLAYLYPLLASGIDAQAAVQRHADLFGYTPALPDTARLSWDGRVPRYDGFGTLMLPEQPPFDPDAVFGALQGVGKASASMQFEDTGLRTIVRWTCTSAAP